MTIVIFLIVSYFVLKRTKEAISLKQIFEMKWKTVFL